MTCKSQVQFAGSSVLRDLFLFVNQANVLQKLLKTKIKTTMFELGHLESISAVELDKL